MEAFYMIWKMYIEIEIKNKMDFIKKWKIIHTPPHYTNKWLINLVAIWLDQINWVKEITLTSILQPTNCQ